MGETDGWNGKQASASSRSVGVGSDKRRDKTDEARMTTAQHRHRI
jgi:hypothetical protein